MHPCADLMQLDGSPAQSMSNGSPRVAELMSASRPRAAAARAPPGERSVERPTIGGQVPPMSQTPVPPSAGQAGQVKRTLCSERRDWALDGRSPLGRSMRDCSHSAHVVLLA